MQCREFNKLLPLLLNGAVAPDSRDACELHLDTCNRCVEVFAAASAAMFVAPDPGAMISTIMQATMPATCATSADLLCEALDGTLGEPESVLLHSHLQDCGYCQQLHSKLQTLDRELPMLAELQPPETLLAQILHGTSARPPPGTHHLNPWFAPIRRVLLRPRFALEAAFTATLLWSALFGIPASVLDTASAEQPQVIERLELRQFWTQTQSGLQLEIAELGPELSGPVSALENIFFDSVESARRRGNMLRLHLADWFDTLLAGILPGPI